MWPVYARALREVFVSAMSAEEAAVMAAALGRVAPPGAGSAPPPAEL